MCIQDNQVKIDRQLRGGCLQYIASDGEKIIACPHDPIYSTISMVAQFYWSERLRCWMPFESDDES